MIDRFAEMYDRLPPKKRALIPHSFRKTLSWMVRASALTRHRMRVVSLVIARRGIVVSPSTSSESAA